MATAKNVVSQATSNISSINLNSEEKIAESTTSKLLSLFKEVQTKRATLNNAYLSVLNYRNIVGQSFLIGSTAAYYRRLIEIELEAIRIAFRIYKVTHSESTLTTTYEQINQSIGDLFNTDLSDTNNLHNLAAKIKSLLSQLLDLLYSLQEEGTIPSNLNYDPVTKQITTDYAVNLNISDNRSFKIFYGKIKNNNYIAQEANISGVFYNDCNDSKKLRLNIPIIDINNQEYTYTQYPPLDFRPLNTRWTDRRYCSPEFQVENPNAEKEDKSDMYLTAYSLIYFNGSRFFGSDEINYNSITESDTDSITVLTSSDNSSNQLRGTVHYSREIKPRIIDVKFNYNDSSIDPATRPATQISDSIEIEMNEDTATNPYSASGTLSYDADMSAEGDATYYTGTLSVESDLLKNETDIPEDLDPEIAEQVTQQYATGTSIQVICKVTRTSSRTYDIELKIDTDNSSNSALLESEEAEDLIALAFCTFNYKDIKASNVVQIDTSETGLFRNLKETEELSGLLSQIIDGINSGNLEEVLKKLKPNISALASSLALRINSLSKKASTEISTSSDKISSYINTFTNIYSYIQSNDSYFERDYFSELNTLFVTFNTELTEESSKALSESNLIEVIESNISTIQNNVDTMLTDAISVFEKIENISNNYESILPNNTISSTISSSVNTRTYIVNGNSLEAAAFTMGGYPFIQIPVPITYNRWNETASLFIDNDGYIYYLLYILNIFRNLLKRDIEYEVIVKAFRTVSLSAYYKRMIAPDILTDDFKNTMTSYFEFVNKYGLRLSTDLNSEFVSSGLTYKFNSLNFYNNINLTELLSETELKANFDNILQYYKVGFYKPLVSIPVANMTDTIVELNNIFANSKMNFRTLIAYHSFLLTLSDIYNYVTTSDNKDSVINKSIAEAIQQLLKADNSEITTVNTLIFEYTKFYNKLYANSNYQIYINNNGVFL